MTGANEYRFYRGGKLIGSVTALVAPCYPVLIKGADITLYCTQDPEATIFPGCSNAILSGTQEYAKVIYQGHGQHSLQLGLTSLQVRSDNHRHYYFLDSQLLAILQNISAAANCSADWELRQILYALPNITEELLLLMLSFPFLRIGL